MMFVAILCSLQINNISYEIWEYRKQKFKLKDVVIGNGIFTPKCLSLNFIRKNSVVCDGGATESDA